MLVEVLDINTAQVRAALAQSSIELCSQSCPPFLLPLFLGIVPRKLSTCTTWPHAYQCLQGDWDSRIHHGAMVAFGGWPSGGGGGDAGKAV